MQQALALLSAPTTTPGAQQSLGAYTRQALQSYFIQLEGNTPSNLYELVLTEIELPLLDVVLQQACGNQTKAAKWLGLSRSTLRKKLQSYYLESK